MYSKSSWWRKEIATKLSGKNTINKHIESVHEEKSHSNVILVNLDVLKGYIWGLSYQLFIKWKSCSNVIFVMRLSQQSVAWNFISIFMKERSLVCTCNICEHIKFWKIWHVNTYCISSWREKANVNFAYIAVTMNAA